MPIARISIRRIAGRWWPSRQLARSQRYASAWDPRAMACAPGSTRRPPVGPASDNFRTREGPENDVP
jgi:hypothetical protein